MGYWVNEEPNHPLQFAYNKRVFSVLLVTAALLATVPAAKRVWYGPATVSFDAKFEGNPYDPAVNDVRAVFTDGKGAKTERIAYFDRGKWKATLVAERKGRYTAKLIRNGREVDSKPDPAEAVLDKAMPNGFVRRDPKHSNRFVLDDGKPYFPLGHDLGWPSGPMSIPQQLEKMHGNGIDWTRIWAASWSNMNPWWANEAGTPEDEMWPTALDNWNTAVESCEKNRIRFQFVLFYHGAFSSTVNPNWPGHPWNSAKDGFLKSAAAFFTDPEAKRRTKMWLRYAVARWGHSPSVMAWELFNEVEWVDAMMVARPTVAAWHKEMAAYLRDVDPYDHLVTTSSTMDYKPLWEAMDYYQPHTYPADVTAAILGRELPGDKPLFFGEFGPQDMKADLDAVIRDGVYAAMVGGHAGTGMFWYWDQMHTPGRYAQYGIARKVIALSRIADHPNARRVAARISTTQLGETVVRPGRGWGKTEVFRFAVPADVTPETMGRVSSFLQSQTGGNKALCPEPLEFAFDAPAGGVAEFHIATLSRAGAHVVLTLDGKAVDEYDGPAGDKDRPVDVTLKAPYKAGKHVLRVGNDGPDWVVFDRLKLAPFGPAARVVACSTPDWMLARVTGGKKPLQFSLAGLPLRDGVYAVTAVDLDSGRVMRSEKSTKGGAVKQMEFPGKDVVLVLERRR